MQQTEKYWNLINRIVLIAIIIMAGVGVVLAFAPKVRQLREYQGRNNALQQRIDETVAYEQELKNQQRRFYSDPEFVEKIAHEVGYAHTNETIFHFPEETGRY